MSIAVGGPHWLDELQRELEQREAAGLRRQVRPISGSGPRVQVNGRWCVNLGSNDYLGLSQHPRLIQAAVRAAETYGVGSPSSRLLGGTLEIHRQVEQRFARFKQAPAAVMLPTGYMANQAVLCSLAGPGDLICLDKLVHASLIDAARLSGAMVRTYPHLDLARLARLLSRFREQQTDQNGSVRQPRCLIVTDSVFSMDGDVADLPGLCDLARTYQAITVVDEAHGTGVLGHGGAGLCQHQQVSDRVDVVISTASKALGCLGGMVTGHKLVIDTLVNRGRQFIYTTAVPPMQAAAIGAAVEVVEREPWRRERLAALTQRLRQGLFEQGWPVAVDEQAGCPTPIVPVVTGSAQAALALADRLLAAGYFAPAVRPPTVRPNSARVRLSLRADLDEQDVDGLLAAVGRR